MTVEAAVTLLFPRHLQQSQTERRRRKRRIKMMTSLQQPPIVRQRKRKKRQLHRRGSPSDVGVGDCSLWRKRAQR